MSLSAAALIPLLTQLGTYFKMGVDHYADVRASGGSLSPDALSLVIYTKMMNWNPKVSGRNILDDDTRSAASRLLAGLIINMTGVA
jgi:hypothetical protein